MEIGSFIEMQFEKNKEFYSVDKDIARLNSGCAAIYHAVRILGVNEIFIPFYQCSTVRDFLLKKNIKVRYYNIDKNFNPLLSQAPENAAVLIVNYYGVMSITRLQQLTDRFENVIIDNCQGFFSTPIYNNGHCMNVYSARKFVGVPDGSYVIGENAEKFTEEYEQDYSSDTSCFLLKRIEYGCDADTYQEKLKNEQRIDSSDIKKMSKLTHAILDGIDYDLIIQKRRENFEIASELFRSENKINPQHFYDETCVPMVYPLVIEDDKVFEKLIDSNHYQGHWWSYLLQEMNENTFEYWLSRYIIPITIDQRYGEKELNFIRNQIG